MYKLSLCCEVCNLEQISVKMESKMAKALGNEIKKDVMDIINSLADSGKQSKHM